MSNEEQVIQDILTKVESKEISKSEGFRELYRANVGVGQIAKLTDSHYSFVYGVISQTFGSVKTEGRSGPSKSDQIRELSDQGLTPGQIAKQLNSNYSFVHSVVKKYRKQQELAQTE